MLAAALTLNLAACATPSLPSAVVQPPKIPSPPAVIEPPPSGSYLQTLTQKREEWLKRLNSMQPK
jgi:hypothetical protein